MKCPECGKEFAPLTVVQKYCSTACGARYRRKHEGEVRYPSITFTCANYKCGRLVVTDGKKDKRTRFCCAECEKKYWKHPPHEGPALRTNFHSVSEYASWERRTNG